MDSFSLHTVYQWYAAEFGSESLTPTQQQIGATNLLCICRVLRNLIRKKVDVLIMCSQHVTPSII